MSANSNIAFILVPGSFAGPETYHKVTVILESKEYTVAPVSLLSAGDRSPEPPATMYDDAAEIRSAIINLLDASKSVVLVMNSYGGVPGTQCLQGLGQSERGDGNAAVIALVYIAGTLLPKDMSPFEIASWAGDEANTSAPPGDVDTDPYMYLDAKLHPPFVFSDLPQSEHSKYFDTMSCHSRVSFTNRLTCPGYKVIPSTYIVPEEDMIIPPKMQHRMVDAANEGVDDVAKKMKKVVLKGSGHVPMLSRPEEVVKLLLEAAGRVD